MIAVGGQSLVFSRKRRNALSFCPPEAIRRSLCWSVQIVTLTTSQRMLESAPARSRYALGPGEAVFGEREGADAFAGDDEDSVADGGEDRREGGFAEGGG